LSEQQTDISEYTHQEISDALGIPLRTFTYYKSKRPDFPWQGTLEDLATWVAVNHKQAGNNKRSPIKKKDPKPPPAMPPELAAQLKIESEWKTRKLQADTEKAESVTAKNKAEAVHEARNEIIKEARQFLGDLKKALYFDRTYTGKEIIEIINKLRGE